MKPAAEKLLTKGKGTGGRIGNRMQAENVHATGTGGKQE